MKHIVNYINESYELNDNDSTKEKIINDLKTKRFCKYTKNKNKLTWSIVCMTFAYYGFICHELTKGPDAYSFLGETLDKDRANIAVYVNKEYDYEDEFTNEDIDNLKWRILPR